MNTVIVGGSINNSFSNLGERCHWRCTLSNANKFVQTYMRQLSHPGFMMLNARTSDGNKVQYNR